MILISIYFIKIEINKLFGTEENPIQDKAEDRQALVIPVLGAPFLAASLPLAAAGAIGIYGTYGEEILTLLNSFIGNINNNILF